MRALAIAPRNASGLAVLDLRRGEVDAALAVLDVPPAEGLHARLEHTKRIVRLLHAHRSDRALRLAFIERAVRRDVLDTTFPDEYSCDEATRYVN